jgi:hypothetical protein
MPSVFPAAVRPEVPPGGNTNRLSNYTDDIQGMGDWLASLPADHRIQILLLLTVLKFWPNTSIVTLVVAVMLPLVSIFQASWVL